MSFGVKRREFCNFYIFVKHFRFFHSNTPTLAQNDFAKS